MRKPLESPPTAFRQNKERRIVSPTGGAEILYLDDRTAPKGGYELVTYEVGDCTAVPCWGETEDKRPFAMLLHIPPNKTPTQVLEEADISTAVFGKIDYKLVPGLETKPSTLRQVEEGIDAAFGALPKAGQQAIFYYEAPRTSSPRTKVELNVTPRDRVWVPQITVTGPLNPFD